MSEPVMRVQDSAGVPALMQILEGQRLWSLCTPVQKRILERQVTVINDQEKSPAKRYAVVTQVRIPHATNYSRTMNSLTSKGITDRHGRLTLNGAWAVLWGPKRGDRP